MSDQNVGSADLTSKQCRTNDEALATILDKSQRADLMLLVANATESMRNLLVENFNATSSLEMAVEAGDENPVLSDHISTNIQDLNRKRNLKEGYEGDLQPLQTKNLKVNSIRAFDQWREAVIIRVGTVINSEEAVRHQLQHQAKSGSSQPQAPDTTPEISDTSKQTGSIEFKDLFPPTTTPLAKLPVEKRILVLHSMFLLLLSLEHYSAPSRILLLNLTSSLKLPLETFEEDEERTAQGLLEAAKTLSADEETKKKGEENKDSRKWKVGLATVAGAAIIGITGGLAAPLVAAGVGSVMGGLGLGATAAAGYLGSVAGSTVIMGTLFGAYGGRMTGKMMDQYAKEVEDFGFLPVHCGKKSTSGDQTRGIEQAIDDGHKLRVSICISGWLTDKDDVVKPWRVLGTAAEVFALRYEMEALLNLGNSMNGMVRSTAWRYAKSQIISRVGFGGVTAALMPITMLSRIIDNPFSVAKARSDKAGEVLADALVNKAQGERPVTLIGFSLGARVIFSCLMSLAKRNAFHLIENVVLIGAPTPSDTSDWRVLRAVVSGRLVNVFSENDYILNFMYRTSSVQYGVAGLQKVEGLPGVENVDVSAEVNGHLRYRYLIGAILRKIGFSDIDMQAASEERLTLERMELQEKRQQLQAEREKLQQQKLSERSEKDEAELEAAEIERQAHQQTEKSLKSSGAGSSSN